MTLVITSELHRVQRGHGRAFRAKSPPKSEPVHRPARVAIMLALAHAIAAAIAEGRLGNQAEAARGMGMTPARITQLLALLQLAPDVQERVLTAESVDGLEWLTERALRDATRLLDWAAQRAALAPVFSKASARAAAAPAGRKKRR